MGLTLMDGTCPLNFFNPIDLEIHTKCALSWRQLYEGGGRRMLCCCNPVAFT